ncbi:hypothetical protein Q4610_15620 [Sphingobium sp. HBC34]|uniref:Antitoxin Xre/MbcA/ParS-like toxin-binding domain-containing protein n=1 Tax=Sphingobium cyanobacteriorum TaxID=3063954 RepID=A0ABT8ZPP2_9SPHN|nr:hypothetical protein [Sphingobium sp. HBC34]MDO7836476.1 hypothetical protein [Sphingobium sp. HBC34]
MNDIREGDGIVPRRMAERLRLPMMRLSRLAHLNRTTMAARSGSPAVQAEPGEITRIVARAADLAGNEGKAIIWFKHLPPAGFGRTAKELVEDGHADIVIEHHGHMAADIYS